MKSLTLIFFTMLAGCASKPFAQELLPDGKTWQATVYDIRCDSGEAKCKHDTKERVAARAKVLCADDSYKILTCDLKPASYQTDDAVCLIKCTQPSKQ